jgi:IS5 family transposase
VKQMTLARGGFEQFGKTTKRAAFLAEMDQVLPWGELCALLEPFYPKGGGRGRPPVGLERMLRIHFLQHWFNLSGPAVEEALYESRSMREFVGIDLGHGPAPDETTICKFRHLLERHELGRKIFEASRRTPAGQGLPAEHRDHRRCHVDRCAEFDQELQGRA